MPQQQLFLRYFHVFLCPILSQYLSSFMEWSGVSFLMVDLCPRSCLAKEEFVLGPPSGGSDRISFLHLLTQTLMEVFSCPQVSQSPQIGSFTQHIHRYGLLGLSHPQQPLEILLSYSMGGQKDLDVIVAPLRLFYTTSDSKVSFNYPSRIPDVSVYEARLR